MKKYLFIIVFVPILFSACEMGYRIDSEEYVVSGHVYYPDSITPIRNKSVDVLDQRTYGWGWDAHETDKSYNGLTDENGYFKIIIPDGGKSGIRITVYTNPDTVFNNDTIDRIYQYRADVFEQYNGKHGFEDLQIYTNMMELPLSYPYLVPSYPFIGDSVLVVAQEPIEKIHLLEKNTELFSMEYNTGDTAVMFFLPETLSIEKQYYLDIYCVTEQGYHYTGINLNHLRKHEE